MQDVKVLELRRKYYEARRPKIANSFIARACPQPIPKLAFGIRTPRVFSSDFLVDTKSHFPPEMKQMKELQKILHHEVVPVPPSPGSSTSTSTTILRPSRTRVRPTRYSPDDYA